jgi:hypothetical protein
MIKRPNIKDQPHKQGSCRTIGATGWGEQDSVMDLKHNFIVPFDQIRQVDVNFFL